MIFHASSVARGAEAALLLGPPGSGKSDLALRLIQGGWTLVQSFSMGSALFVSGLLLDVAGWRGAWMGYTAITLAAALLLFAFRERFLERAGER